MEEVYGVRLGMIISPCGYALTGEFRRPDNEHFLPNGYKPEDACAWSCWSEYPCPRLILRPKPKPRELHLIECGPDDLNCFFNHSGVRYKLAEAK